MIQIARCDQCNKNLTYEFNSVEPIIKVKMMIIRKDGCEDGCKCCRNKTKEIEEWMAFCSFGCFHSYTDRYLGDSRLEAKWKNKLNDCNVEI